MVQTTDKTAAGVMDSQMYCTPAKRLNGVKLPLLHTCGLSSLDDRHRFARMNLVGPYGVTIKVTNSLDLA